MALVGVLEAFSRDGTSRAAAAAAGATPMAALLAVFNAAESLDGIRPAGEGRLPERADQCRTPEEAQRWLGAAKLRTFNKNAVDLRRKCLAALLRRVPRSRACAPNSSCLRVGLSRAPASAARPRLLCQEAHVLGLSTLCALLW